MYHGRPPPRGGYPPPFEGRGPRPPRPYQSPGYRDDRIRPRPPYQPDYHDRSHPDPYHRSPPRRRYPSPGSGSHRGGEFWSVGPPREKCQSPRGPVPLDHNLVITVGNELIGPSSSGPSHHHDRNYPPRPDYERSRSRPCSPSRDQSLDRSRAKSCGRSKSRARSKSRPRSQSRSPGRSRAKSRPRSQSRSPGRRRAKSRGRSKSHSRDRSRAKSRGRSKSRPRSKSRGRSKSRPRSRSRSTGRRYGHSKSRQRSRSRSRGRSVASTSRSSSHSRDNSVFKEHSVFKELETARRRKELEEMLMMPTKSILKKRHDSEDSPSLRRSDSVEGSSMSQVADQLLLAVKGMEPHKVASMLAELQANPGAAQRSGLDTEIKEILSLLGGSGASKAQGQTVEDIDDEEKFLYGDSEEPKPPPVSEPLRHLGLDLYGDVTEEVLYGDYSAQKASAPSMYGHIPAPASVGEMDMSSASRSAVGLGHNITVQVSNPACPPGMEPLEDSERQALEEYEKIQDLLKTIGLDLGVTEISKMAARTKERLHGTKPPPKTPTRRRRYSSGNSDDSQRNRKRRSRSGSSSRSSSRSRSRSGGRAASWSSNDDDRRGRLSPSASHKERKTERCDTAPSPLDSNTLTPHPGAPIPTYPPSQTHGPMHPNYPPPGYGQYGHYLPYMHQQWPPMYPPPNVSLPPQTGPEIFLQNRPYEPYNTGAPEPGTTGLVKSAQDGATGKVSSRDSRESEEQNNESQKQKVLEEREKLREEREIRMKKKEYLMTELERLRKQQGELLRKKRREKGGHKDPLLQEISHLQEEVMTQISNLRKEHEAAERKRTELEKVALILGLTPSDRPRKTSKSVEDRDDEPALPPPKKERREAEMSPERQQMASSSMIKQTSVVPPLLKPSPDKPAANAPPLTPSPEPFEYYDAGNHWCQNCNVTSGSMFDFFTHLHSKTHRKTLDPYDRPWASTGTKTDRNSSSEEKLTKPAKGSEFLQPVRGFFCLLCKEFYGDAICAEEHVTTHAHNEKYKKQMYENPLYEKRRNLDRQAGLTLEASGKKRKHEDEEKGSKDKEEKSKHKKDKKDKKKEEDDSFMKEDKSKLKKEEGEEERMESKKEQDSKDAKTVEEERPSYSRKDEDEKYKFSRKDDKYKYSREEEERGKGSRREDDDRYKYRDDEYRNRYRRDEDNRYDDHRKYGPREDEDRYKYGKYSDNRPKYDRDEGKYKVEKEAHKKFEPAKPAAVSKPEPPSKPYDPPKIFCGPSPAMRAKLLKQSLESGKQAPGATSFGKFTWKKRENVLAKEAQKVAAEFIKDDEAAVKNQGTPEDSFSKSMAVAKEIADKLAGQPTMAPPWYFNRGGARGGTRGRIRPNLPAPAAGMRKAAMIGKPAPLNTFLSIRPQNTSLIGSPPKDPPKLSENILKTAQSALTDAKPVPPDGPSEVTPAQAVPISKTLESQPQIPVSRPAPLEPKPVPSESTPAPSMTKASLEFKPTPPVSMPGPPVCKPLQIEAKPVTSVAKTAPFAINPAPAVSGPSSVKSKPVQSAAKPSPTVPTPSPPAAKPTQPTMIKIVSDVAAPGVPESEQTRTVFVKPPPFMTKGDVAQKSEKLKSNLAAAKAQDLFDIFYSSISQSGPSSFTKAATDDKADRPSTNKTPLPAVQTQKPQPQPQPVTQSKPLSVVSSSPQPDSNNSPTHQMSGIQIASVWSLQSSSATTVEGVPPQTASEPTKPQLNPPAQSEPLSAPPSHSSTPKSESQITTQIKSVEQEPAPQPQSPKPKLNPQIHTEPQSEPQVVQDTQPPYHPETHADTTPEPEPKPGTKTRGKTTKRTPPAPRPIRQTRSQTRYQNRQQHSQSEPEPKVDSEGVLDVSNSGSAVEEGTSSEGMMDITPETLDLPSDMTSVDFETDFNFE